MKTVSSLSGGRTSSYMAIHFPVDYRLFALVCIDDPACAPKDKKLVQMINDKLDHFGMIERYGEFVATAEDDKTLSIMFQLEQELGKEITWLRGKSYDTVIDEGTKTRLPSWARRYCTQEMKLRPIAEYCVFGIGEKVKMDIGFRADELERYLKFQANPKEKNSYKLHTHASLVNKIRPNKWKLFEYREANFPLVNWSVYHPKIIKYWENKPEYKWPETSNCIGCFHKPEQLINQQWSVNPKKIQWFADQEKKGKGTWLDNKNTYEQIKKMNFTEEINFEGFTMCNSGGCTD